MYGMVGGVSEAGITVGSDMVPSDVLAFAEAVAIETRGVTWDLNKKVRFTTAARGGNTVTIAVGLRMTSPFGATVLL